MRAIFGRLEEATYARDRSVRDRAERFYQDLYRYLDADEETLRRRLAPQSGGRFSVMAGMFSTDEDLPQLAVVFTPKQGTMQGGMGKAGHLVVMTLPVLIGPNDVRFLATRVTKKVVVHEMVHFLDPGRSRGLGGARAIQHGDVAYYNEPGEWNAFWQEGAADLERTRQHLGGMPNPKVFEVFFGDGSLKALQARVTKFWDVEFIDNMTAATRRKFDKRLAALWERLREAGLLTPGGVGRG